MPSFSKFPMSRLAAMSLRSKQVLHNQCTVPHRHFSQLSTVVSITDAKNMPKHYNEMPGSLIITMAINGDQEAREERLIREIMSTDNVEWEDARKKFITIMKHNRQGLFVATLPYKIGIFTAVTAGVISIPLLFHLETVLFFNENFVTTDVPEDKDLETPLEVASWAWNWYARAQLENLGAKPYTAAYKARRAARLCKDFPIYNKCILTSFSEGDSFTPDSLDSTY